MARLAAAALVASTLLGPPGARLGLAAPAPPSVTAHVIELDGRAVQYAATAGTEPVADRSGKLEANMFFVAYTEQPSPGRAKRPITFAFNGGPGAASVLLHLDALGPKRVRLADDGRPLSPAGWLDNPSTWLGFTDLVFIDAVGTGYSRPAAGVPADTFDQVDGDARSFAAFIHAYLAANHREHSPVFLAGESYGGTRAAILARMLPRDFGARLAGLILISPVLDFETLDSQFRTPGDGTDLAYATDIPTYAATAWYHHKLGAAVGGDLPTVLREAERWAVTDYLPALVRGDALPAQERAQIAWALSQYTGVPADVVEANRLRLLPSVFRRELLRDRRLELGSMDGRIAFDPQAASQFTTAAIVAPLGPVMDEYARTELGYRAGEPYEPLSGRVGRDWDWGPGGATGFLDVTDDLREAMLRDPAMKVLVARGYYDLTVPYFGTDYALNRLHLPPALQANVVRTYYSSGHMIYTSETELRVFTADVFRFVASALAAARP